ncbi:hypothetical protein P4V86_01995 [Brevibacillus laterosporus]|uniref:hypothetical protein n=1 Tax=Brevibacillus laterosporus TaxID=1465 RepID=UPI00036C7D31|nr:hypothetical protein [Brevibacillus laterosporus]ATO48409.1 hypothetical protein BrL25_04370 [Brevibacillus laterosporus DSM 25]MBG9803188.1 hypothetical protein [Brevibacillus laterosporus]MED2002126.1 hypothetical protein [Brevibacillus laterosporus]MED4765465.1 hypothetical protein [Brevibacillus laterosporus]TPH11838.1 hypothetical protein EGH09_18630 [Brevibacillus laterosporus]
MKDRDPYKQIQELLTSQPVPKIDVKKKLMNAIYADQRQEEKKVKKKLGLLLTVGLLVGASSVWAGIQTIELKNDKGEVVYEVTKLGEYQQEQMMKNLQPEVKEKLQNRSEEIYRQLDIGDKILTEMKPGSAVAIYWPITELQKQNQLNPRPVIDVKSKPFTFTTWKNMEQKVGNLFKLPSELGDGFHFTEGEAIYYPSKKYNEELMKAEQEKTKKEYIVQEIPITDKLRNAEVEYKGEKGSVYVDVSLVEDGKSNGGTFAKTLEKGMVGDNEAVYSIFTSKNEDSTHSLDWVKNGTKVEYSLRAKMNLVTKEELFKMAKQVNQAK